MMFYLAQLAELTFHGDPDARSATAVEKGKALAGAEVRARYAGQLEAALVTTVDDAAAEVAMSLRGLLAGCHWKPDAGDFRFRLRYTEVRCNRLWLGAEPVLSTWSGEYPATFRKETPCPRPASS
jgi:hypothetical protein